MNNLEYKSIFLVLFLILSIIITGCIQSPEGPVEPTPTPSVTKTFSNEQVKVSYEPEWINRITNTSEFKGKYNLKSNEDLFQVGIVIKPIQNNTEVSINPNECILIDTNANLYQPISAFDQEISMTFGGEKFSTIYHWFSYGVPKTEILKSFIVQYSINPKGQPQQKISGSITIPI